MSGDDVRFLTRGALPSGQALYGILVTRYGPKVGIQWGGDDAPHEFYPQEARDYLATIRAMPGRGKLANLFEKTISICEERRTELGLPINAAPLPEVQEMFLSQMAGVLTQHLASRGEAVVGHEEPQEGESFVGVSQQGDTFRVCIHEHGCPPRFMTPQQARKAADEEEANGNTDGSLILRACADEVEAKGRTLN